MAIKYVYNPFTEKMDAIDEAAGEWDRIGSVLSPKTAGDDVSLEFGDLVSEVNPEGANAIRIKATSSDVDVVLGDASGFFTIWNATDARNTDAVFDVNNDGDATIKKTLSLKEQASAPSARAYYGKLYVMEDGSGNDANTKLLIHADGVDGAQVFTDDSANGFTVEDNGNVNTDDGQKKFGATSALFDGNGDYLRVLHDVDMAFNADFTIDFWVRLNSIQQSGTTTIVRNTFLAKSGYSVPSAWVLLYGGKVGDATDKVRFWNNEVVVLESATDALTTNRWYHIAVSRSGTTMYLFIDGVLVDTGTNSVNFNAVANLFIGKDGVNFGATRDLDGWMDEIRLTKGVARWTSTFTPPTSAYGKGGLYYRHSDGTITGLA